MAEQYAYDARHNRTSLVTSAGTTSYSYNTTNALTQKTDPNGKVTQYTYDTTNGNLTQAAYDPTGLNQITRYSYDANQRLSQVTKPDGTTVTFAYDADGNRVSKTITSGGAFPTTSKVIDVYQAGRIAYETDGANTTLATFNYSPSGTPTSVTVGSNPSTDPRYYYVYNPHGDVVALVDGGGTTVATYSYDEYGTPTIWESFTNGWHNPYLYDGQELVRYDAETSLYWMSVRAYDPALGRFILRDPLGRVPLFFDLSGRWFRRDMIDGGDWIPQPAYHPVTVRMDGISGQSPKKPVILPCSNSLIDPGCRAELNGILPARMKSSGDHVVCRHGCHRSCNQG